MRIKFSHDVFGFSGTNLYNKYIFAKNLSRINGMCNYSDNEWDRLWIYYCHILSQNYIK